MVAERSYISNFERLHDLLGGRGGVCSTMSASLQEHTLTCCLNRERETPSSSGILRPHSNDKVPNEAPATQNTYHESHARLAMRPAGNKMQVQLIRQIVPHSVGIILQKRVRFFGIIVEQKLLVHSHAGTYRLPPATNAVFARLSARHFSSVYQSLQRGCVHKFFKHHLRCWKSACLNLLSEVWVDDVIRPRVVEVS